MRATEAQLASASAQAATMSKRVGRLLVIPPDLTPLTKNPAKSPENAVGLRRLAASLSHATGPPKSGAGVTKLAGSAAQSLNKAVFDKEAPAMWDQGLPV